MKTKPSASFINECFSHDADSGVLTWNFRPSSHFKSEAAARSWNSKFGGTIAGSDLGDGRFKVSINGSNYKVHRVAWCLHYGEWPEAEIDHINGNPSDNRLCNLRKALRHENAANLKKRDDNTSGVPGIVWNKTSGKWQAQIGKSGKCVYLGVFAEKSDAIAARQRAEILLFREFSAAASRCS